MRYTIYSHRHASVLLSEAEFIDQFTELFQLLDGISDEDVIRTHSQNFATKNKSVSKAINRIIKERLIDLGWREESPIFQDPSYQDKTWRLDFAKDDISIEVGFNHSGTVAWNILKPAIASELNHITKAIQTKVGVIITATEYLKREGGFDPAIGTFENYMTYLKAMNSIITVPILLIGLESFDSFYIEHDATELRKKIAIIKYKQRNELF